MLLSFGQFTRKSGAGMAVLLFHVLVLFALRNGGGVLRPSSVEAPQVRYMTLIPGVPAAEQKMRTDSTIASAPKTPKQPSTAAKAWKSPIPEQTVQRLHSEPTTLSAGANSNESTTTRTESPAINESLSDAVNSDSSKKGGILDYEGMKKSARASASGYKDRAPTGASRRVTESEKFENAVAQTKRGDCTNQHAHLGLLAIPFLLKDTLTDTGCKW